MKAFAVALLGLAVTAPAMAGPYVSTKSEFKGDEDGYSKTVHQARLGYGWKLDNGIKHYAKIDQNGGQKVSRKRRYLFNLFLAQF